MLKAKECRDQSLEELVALCEDKRAELFRLVNAKFGLDKSQKTHLIPQLKREIARLLTIIQEKQTAQAGQGE